MDRHPGGRCRTARPAALDSVSILADRGPARYGPQTTPVAASFQPFPPIRTSAHDLLSRMTTAEDVARHGFAIPPHDCASFFRELPAFRRSEGAGNAGCPMHPQPRVRFVVLVCTRVFTAEAPEPSGIPHAMVLRLISRSPRGPGSLAPVIGVMRSIIANLTPASGRQDHATSPSAKAALACRSSRVHRISPQRS